MVFIHDSQLIRKIDDVGIRFQTVPLLTQPAGKSRWNIKAAAQQKVWETVTGASCRATHSNTSITY
jgi:hypothetical protein